MGERFAAVWHSKERTALRRAFVSLHYHQLTDDLDDLMVSSATIAPTFGAQPLARGAGRAECPGT